MTAPTQEVLEAIAATLQAKLPGLATCRVHGGSVTLEEVTRHGVLTPAVLIAPLSLDAVDTGNQSGRRIVATLAAWCLTRDKGETQAWQSIAGIVDPLLKLLPGNAWGLKRCDGADPQSIRAENLFSSTIDGLGISLWGVTWTQTYHLN